MAYIPGLPGPRPQGLPARPKSAPPPTTASEGASEHQDPHEIRFEASEPESELHYVRHDPKPPEKKEAKKSTGGAPSLPPGILRGFLANTRRVNVGAKEMKDGDVQRYSKAPPRNPRTLQGDFTPPASDEAPAPLPFLALQREAHQESRDALEEQTSHPSWEPDELFESLLQHYPPSGRPDLYPSLQLIPRHLLERCRQQGMQVHLSSNTSGYQLDSRRIALRAEETRDLYLVIRALAHAIDHALGGDDLASKRSLAVLAALPGPG